MILLSIILSIFEKLLFLESESYWLLTWLYSFFLWLVFIILFLISFKYIWLNCPCSLEKNSSLSILDDFFWSLLLSFESSKLFLLLFIPFSLWLILFSCSITSLFSLLDFRFESSLLFKFILFIRSPLSVLLLFMLFLSSSLFSSIFIIDSFLLSFASIVKFSISFNISNFVNLLLFIELNFKLLMCLISFFEFNLSWRFSPVKFSLIVSLFI